MAVKPSGAT